ncbi:leucine-rich repeat-containing protein 23 [Pholidichthys leucotaenia]
MSDMDDGGRLSGGEEEAEDEKGKHCKLTQKVISSELSLLCRTGNGLGHAFVKLDLKDKGLNDIAVISNYVHIRFLDLSNNHLTDLSPLASLTQLLWLKVDNNAMKSLKGHPFAQMTYLQWLSIAANQLSGLDELVGPALESLNLSGNRIQRIDNIQSGCFANLVILELRGNQLDTTDGINLPNLRRLYLAQNVIKCLEGLERLERLTILHLRDNKLDSLNGLSSRMTSLQYLNVRGNVIADMNNLQFLRSVSKTLRALVIFENPLVEDSDYRLSILMLLPHLERLNKDPVSPEEKLEVQKRIRETKEEEIPEP